jgi:hypothetical protein
MASHRQKVAGVDSEGVFCAGSEGVAADNEGVADDNEGVAADNEPVADDNEGVAGVMRALPPTMWCLRG